MHPFIYLMFITFAAVVVTLFAGIATLGSRAGQTTHNQRQSLRSNRLMQWRVALGFCLLVEIVVYHYFLKP